MENVKLGGSSSDMGSRIWCGYASLLQLYGRQAWWPCRSGWRWEIVAGAILTQNCAWRNVERALEALSAAASMTPEAILTMPEEDLGMLIRPAGFWRQKATYLKSMAAFVLEHDATLAALSDQEETVRHWRRRLLSVRGVGRETADDILLYAYGLPVFVIDAYTRRFCERELDVDGSLSYDALQAMFQEALPRDIEVYRQYHALVVEWGKQQKSRPLKRLKQP